MNRPRNILIAAAAALLARYERELANVKEPDSAPPVPVRNKHTRRNPGNDPQVARRLQRMRNGGKR